MYNIYFLSNLIVLNTRTFLLYYDYRFHRVPISMCCYVLAICLEEDDTNDELHPVFKSGISKASTDRRESTYYQAEKRGRANKTVLRVPFAFISNVIFDPI